MKTPDEAPARGSTGSVSGATANGTAEEPRAPFSREYLDYWAPLAEAVA